MRQDKLKESSEFFHSPTDDLQVHSRVKTVIELQAFKGKPIKIDLDLIPMQVCKVHQNQNLTVNNTNGFLKILFHSC